MTDTITFATFSAPLLKLAFKFLFNKATDAINTYVGNDVASDPDDSEFGELFDYALDPSAPDQEELNAAGDELIKLKKELKPFENTIDVIEPDAEVLVKLDQLRDLLEAIYQQPLSFRGEQREPNKLNVKATLEIISLRGKVTGFAAGNNAQGNFDLGIKIGTVERDGEFTLVDASGHNK